MSNTLYELALNQEVQDKLREEIKSNLAKHGGELKYEHVKDMEYLDKVFKGTCTNVPTRFLEKEKVKSSRQKMIFH